MMRSVYWIGVVALSLALGHTAAALEPVVVAQADTAPAEAVHASGEWLMQGETVSKAGRRWSVAAIRLNDNEMRGRVTLNGGGDEGNAGEGDANVEARLSGRGVVGKLLDDDGRTLAVFEGAVGKRGASGTFRHVGGGTGTWSWDEAEAAAGSQGVE